MHRWPAWVQRVGSHYIKDIILGANDGIITTFAVVAGVAGAQLSPIVVLIMGFSNLLADGISMGASNYLGTCSEAALETDESRRHVRFSAMLHGVMTFIPFVFAGLVPLLAYLLPIPAQQAFPIAVALTGVTLFVVGALRSLLMPLPWWKAGIEMFLVGALAAGTAYIVGYGAAQAIR